jgi:hypothetical protein
MRERERERNERKREREREREIERERERRLQHNINNNNTHEWPRQQQPRAAVTLNEAAQPSTILGRTGKKVGTDEAGTCGRQQRLQQTRE